MTERRGWSRNELILAVNLYCKTPFGRIHRGNPDIIKLAGLIGRSPGSVAWKMCNFASIDPSLDRKGASHVAKLDVEVWNEFFNNWEDLAFESQNLLAKFENKDVETLVQEEDRDMAFPEGKDLARTVKTRVNQSFFRRMILTSYNEVCCITGISNVELLVASHIMPWASDEKNRLNPMNGLCLNALHDRAFDKGLISIDERYNVIVSKKVKHKLILEYDKKPITLPKRFIPAQQFLDFHRNNIFQG